MGIAVPLEPLSLAGLRTRNVRYWFVALCLASFLSAYASPMILTFVRGDGPSSVLPRLDLAVLGFPVLKVPDVGLPAKADKPSPVATAPTPARRTSAQPTRQQQQVARPVEVVTSSYVLEPPAKQAPKQRATPADPFANVPVVESSIGAVPPASHPLIAASAPPEGEEDTTALTQAELDAAVAQAAAEWEADVSGLTFAIADLEGLTLGSQTGTTITVDVNAAGWGWAQMDLLTVVRHELGHYLGHDHDEGGVMSETLAPGESHTVPLPEPAPEPDVVVAPASVELGEVEVGQAASAAVQVSNQGTADLTVSAISLSSSAAGFSISGPTAPRTVAPGAALEISVSFSPAGEGAASATLTIESDDPNTPSISVALSGIGTVAQLAIAEPDLDFDDVTIDTTVAKSIELSNTGSATLTISALVVSDDATGAFSISDSIPLSIAPGASASISVQMSPSQVGGQSASLVISSNDPDGPSTIDLSGRGTAWLVDSGVARAPPQAGRAWQHILRFVTDRAELVEGTGADEVVDPVALAGISAIEILGGALDDRLTVDATGGVPVPVFYDAGGGNDTLAAATPGTWTVTGAGGGNGLGVTFSSVESLSGSAGDDIVVFAGGSLDTVTTGDGDDLVSGPLAAGSIDLGAGTDTLDFGGVSGDLLVVVVSAGTISATDGVDSVEGAGVESIIGGTGSTTYRFEDGAALAGTIGGAGPVTLDYTAYTTPVVVDLGTGAATGTGGVWNVSAVIGGSGSDLLIGPNSTSAWTLNGSGAGTLGSLSFSGFEQLRGGAAADTFALGGGSVASVDGGGGDDSLVGSDAGAVWTLTGTGSGSAGSIGFSSIEGIFAGSGADTFVFVGGSIAGLVSGGAGVDTLDYSGSADGETVDAAAGTASGTGGIAGFENVVMGAGDDLIRGAGQLESVDGGGGADTFDLSDLAFLLTLVVQLAGVAAATSGARSIGIRNVEHYFGPVAGTTYVFGNGASTAGTVGGAGPVTLDYSLWSTGVVVDLGAGTATATGGIGNVSAVVGGAASDLLVGPAGGATWSVTGPSAGDVDLVTFSGFEQLAGGAGDDIFMLVGGTVDTVDGRDGYDTVAIRGPPAVSWTITGPGSGDVVGVAFTGVEHLSGAPDNEDTFTIQPGGSISGLIDGGDGGFDTLVVSGSFTNLVMTATDRNSGGLELDGLSITFTGLEPVLIDSDASPNSVEFTTTAGDDPDVVLEADPGVSGNLRITGSTFELTSFPIPSVSITINLGDGNDKITLQALGTFSGALTVNGGIGNDEVVFETKTGGGAYTFNGDGGTDTITAVRTTGNFTLGGTSLTANGQAITINSVEAANLTGGGTANTFSISNWAGKTATVTGAAGADVHVLGNNFGTVTLMGTAAGDKLDFTGHTGALTVSASRHQVTSADGSVLNQTATLADQASEIDVSLSALTNLKTELEGILDELAEWVEGASAIAHAIQNVLPLLSPGSEGNLDKLLEHIDAVKAFVAAAKAKIPANPLTLGALINALNGGAAYTGLFAGVVFSTNYRGAGTESATPTTSGALEVFVKISRPETTVAKSIPLDLGPIAESLGVRIDANPALAGIQVPNVNVTAKFAAQLEIGSTTAAGTPTVFLRPGGFLTLGLDASLNLSGLAIDVSFLHTTVTTGTLSLSGSVKVTLTDLTPTDGRILASEITPGNLSSLFTVTEPSPTAFNASITATAAAGVQVADTSTLPLGTATFTASVTGSIFGSSTEPAKIDVTFTAQPSTTVINLLDSFNNVGPNEILSMLQAIANGFTALAGSAILQTEIPFTGKKLGDILAYGTAFKERILDPLFKSGDLLRPDDDGDGDVDLEDLNFSSIQSLLTLIDTELGLTGLLEALYNPVSKELKFTFNFTKALGFGEVKVVETQQGGGGNDEQQSVTVNGVPTPGVTEIGDTFRLAFPQADGTIKFTPALALGAHPNTGAGNVQAALETLVGAGNVEVTSTESSNYRTYDVLFKGALANTNVAVLLTDAVDLAGAFSLNFGGELGDLAGITTSGSFTILAALSAAMTFGINLNASQSIEITPGVYTPAIDLRVELPAGATNNKIQILTVANVNGGTYDLALDLDNNGTIAMSEAITGIAHNVSDAALQGFLNGLTGVSAAVVLSQFGNHRIYTITFTTPTAPPQIVADPTNLTGPATTGKLTGNATFSVSVLHPELKVSDGTNPLQTIAATTAISGLSVTVTAASTSTNTSLADLGKDVESAVNTALATGGHTPGWVTGGLLSTGVLGAGGSASAAHNPLGTTKTDLAFTIVLNGGTPTERKITARVRAVDLLDGSDMSTPNGSLFNAGGTLNTGELNGTFSAATLAAKLQTAIADALSNAGVTGYTFTVTASSGKLVFSVTAVPGTGNTIELLFVPAVQVDAGGGRVSLSSPPVTFSPHALRPGVAVDRIAQPSISGGFSSVAYQELGLLSAPTRLDGVTGEKIEFTMVVNGTSVPVTLVAGNHSSLDGLVTALNTAISTALTGATLAGDLVVAFRIDPVGNRIGLRSKSGSVSSFALQVPLDVQPASGIQLNGAITELGLRSGPGETRRALATEFYLENTGLTGTFRILVPSVTLTATLGFLAVTATGSGTLPLGSDMDELLSATVSISLKNPTSTTVNPNRVTLKQIADALTQGFFFFDPTQAGETGGLPTTGFVSGLLGGGFGVEVQFAPGGALSGLAGTLNAFLKISASSPDWLLSPPTFSDPLGFGAAVRALSATATTLGSPAPSNGVLSEDVRFVISQGTFEAVGFVRAADTTAFTTRAELQAALQGAVDAALLRLVAAGGAGGTVTVAIDGSGNVSLTGTSGLGVRGNLFHVDFQGPDVANVLDRFRNLSFTDVIQGLQMLIDFLRGLQGTGAAGSAIASVLDEKLPLIDRSISELVDLAAALGGRLDSIMANPSGSIQALESQIRAALGLPTGPPILSFDVGSGVLNFDFSFGASVAISRPFSLSLADAGLPSFLSSIVGVSASGTLNASASVTLNLKLGLDLEGADKGFFIDVDDTSLVATASASGTNLEFEARLGPFGLFVKNGSASAGATITVGLVDADGDGRLYIFGLPGGATSDLGHLGNFVSVGNFTTTGSIVITQTAPTCPGFFACATLPLFIGTADHNVPLDFGTATPGGPDGAVTPGWPTAPDNALRVRINLIALFQGSPGAFSFQTPDFDFNNFQLPSLFALLSDPAVIIDGLDRLLLVLQDALSGQIFGQQLPFLGDALKDNPAAKVLLDIRESLLQPLAQTLRENNATLATLVGLIQQQLVNVLGPGGPIATALGLTSILKDRVGTSPGITIDDILLSGVNLANPLDTTPFLQFDFDLEWSKTISAAPIQFDLGIPVLGIDGELQPNITINFSLHFGFGIHQDHGLYFVTNHTPELQLGISVAFSSTACPAGTVTRANVNGRLLFLALKIQDGVDLDQDLAIDVNCGAVTNPKSEELSKLFLTGSVDIADPSGDGKLTLAEMVSGSFRDIVKPSLSGGALLRASITVDFSTLSPEVARALPKVTASLLIDFVITVNTSGFNVGAPGVAIADIKLDLGEFISKFAAPILNGIKEVLDPLAWLIGPDGFLNRRIPLLSDLAGRTITGKDLVLLFDQKNGPTVVAFLDFVEGLYNLINLVNRAASEGNLEINFGDLVLSNQSYYSTGFPIINQPIGFSLPGITDLRRAPSLSTGSLSNLPSDPFAAAPLAPAQQSFSAGVRQPGGFRFLLLEPENLLGLFMGKPVKIFEVDFPVLGFDFFYRQEFPIIGPLVGTFAGGVGAQLKMGFGYDTLGIQNFVQSGNPGALLDGFYLIDYPEAEATLTATIAVGAALSIVVAKVGVEGGITATILFDLADLDHDGRVRFKEIAENLAANDFNPLAMFDISGYLEFFLRAYIEINLFITKITFSFEFARLRLFEFNIDFNRPAVVANLSGGALTLHIGASAGQRLNGNLSDFGETIFLATDGGDIVVWGSDFDRPDLASGMRFATSSVTKIFADGGAGNDTINLSGITDPAACSIEIEIRGGAGNDAITGSSCGDKLFGDDGNDTLNGGPGADELHGGNGTDILNGGDGDDQLFGDAGTDTLNGEGDNDEIQGGAGDDTYVRSGGNDTYELFDFGSDETITGTGPGSDTLDFTGMAVNLVLFLTSTTIKVGWGQIGGTAGTDISHFDHRLHVLDATAITLIHGGSFVDTFHVTGTANAITLNGGKGNDVYDFYTGSSAITATVTDTGDPWNSGDLIQVIDGASPFDTTQDDTITVTSTTLTINAAATQVITYTAPAATANVLSIRIDSRGGNDLVTVSSTHENVPVRVETGTGNDKVVVGGPNVNSIAGLARPGLNAPFGVGPLVVVGGSGTDVIVVDDSGDATGGTGTLTAWRESRVGVTDPVEVGVVSGFGMTMKEGLSTGAGRVEFEGMEIVELKLGSGADTVWIGGDTLFGSDTGDLPQNRQDIVTEFVHSPHAMKAILTGGGDDSVRVVSTALIPNRDTFSSGLGLLTMSTTTPGVIGTTDEVQSLTISSAARGHGYFTLQLRYEETAPIALNATAAEIEAALAKLLLVGNASNVSVSGSGTFTITFANTLGNVEQLVARLIPLLVNTEGGADTVRAQAIYEETVLQGGAGNDHIWVNVSATTGDPLTFAEITPDVLISTTQGGTGLLNEIQQIVLQDVTGGTYTLSQGGPSTVAIKWDAPATAVQKALEGILGAGNVTVVRTAPNTYLVEFVEALANTNVPQLTANLSGLRSNGVNAVVTIDGQAASDLYDVYLIGQGTDSLVNVFDTGGSGTDQLVVYGTNETFTPDTFLLRASTSDKGLAFIALINAADPFAVQPGDPVERVNYNINLELITVEGRDGDDSFYIDDTRAQIVINAGKGNDFFQVGQLYQSRRTPQLAGVAPEDVFATIETTRGWLSNGISNPMTINGEDGEDLFIVFHNIATLTLRGGADDDTFIVQAFALAGSENPIRGLTDLSGDAGADFVQYAVNAPVKIDGGDGFDTVIVIGTEFPDDFVVTKNGVFGAGLNVSFTNIEFLEVDGAEGDDRFFILSTGINFTTIITGGLGTDLFSVQGPTPANGVISNDLLGHSGIVTHSVEGTLDESEWSGLKVVGVAANVQDNDEPSVIITQSGGSSQVVQGASLSETAQGIDSFTVVLGRPPLLGETVRIDVPPVPGLVFLDAALSELRLAGGEPDGVQLDFTAANWWIPQTVRFKVDDSFTGEIPDAADIQMRAVVALAFTDPIVEGGTIAGTVQSAGSFLGTNATCVAVGGNACSTMTTGDATFPTASAGLSQGLRGQQLKITGGDDEAAGQVRLILANTATSLTLNAPWSVEPAPGAIFEISLFSAVKLTTVHVRIYSEGRPEVVLDETQGSTSVAEGAGAFGDDTVRVRLSSELTGAQTVTVALGGSGQLTFWDGVTQVTELVFTSANWNMFKTLTVKAVDDLVVEGFHKADLTLTVTGASGTTAYNGVTALTVVDLADDEWPGVRVLESNGSTNVIEFDPVNHGVTEAGAVAAGFPKSDTYQIVLTRAPAETDPVTITVRAEPTRTTRTGGIVSFIEQVLVCVIGPGVPCTSLAEFAFEKTVVFDDDNWNVPRTVVMRAVDDARVDGQDTQVFAPQLDLLNNIQGPLFIRGGLGEDRTGLFEREPVMLPGEFNRRPSMGDVVSATEASGPTPATITIDPSTLSQIVVATTDEGTMATFETQEIEVRATGGTWRISFDGGTTWSDPLAHNASALDVETALEALGTGDVKVSQNSNIYKVTWKVTGDKAELTTDAASLKPLAPADIVDFTIQITNGTAKNKIRIVKSAVAVGPNWLLTLDKPWLSPFTMDASVPDATSEYALFVTNPNLLVKEETQADILWISDADNPGSFNDPNKTPNPFGIGQLFFDESLFGPKVRISTFTNGGVAGADEVQRLQIVNGVSGTFTLRFGTEVTGTIPYNATAAQIQTALENLSNIGAGNVTVVFDAGLEQFVITFVGTLGGTDQPLLRADTALLVGGNALDKMRLVGFGMGGDRVIGGAPQPGGITFEEIEDLRIDLGPGNSQLTIDDTHAGKTVVNTGAGNDVVYVKTISGHTYVNLGAGSDSITVTSDADKLNQVLGLLTVSGDTPRAEVITLAKGSQANAALAVNAVDEIQQVTIDATGGTFTLSLGGHTTAPIAYNATAQAVEDALEALASIGAGNVLVHKAGSVYRITFVGTLAGQDVALLAANGSGLTNGAGATDTMTIDDTATTADTWALLTSSSLTGLSMPGPNEIQQLVIDATGGTFTVSFGAATTDPLAWDVSALDLQAALEGLAGIGAGNVAVTKNDDVYVIRFQGDLSNTDVDDLTADGSDLSKAVEQLGGAVVTGAGSASLSTRRHGGATAPINNVQVLTVDATGGVYRLSFAGGSITTGDIPYDASAEVLRQLIQDAIAQGDVFAALKFDVTVERYENVYVIGFQGNFRSLEDGPGVDFFVAHTPLLAGTVAIQTRMDGINYYGLEVLNITTGSGSEVFNVQGTTPGSGGFALDGGIAVTNVSLNDGDDRVFASSNADLDHASWSAFQFLTGTVDDFRGALNLDLGLGRHRLFVSDEGTSVGDTDVRISDSEPAALDGLSTSAEIWVTGLAPRGISYTVAGGGNLFDGVVYWTGSGDDTIAVDGTHRRAGERTTTLLDTGLGNDDVTVTLTDGSDGFFTLFTSGGSTTDDPLPIADQANDDDVVDASGSSLPLVIIGGFGNDRITGGTSRDVIFGDFGRVQYYDPETGLLVATHGFGGRGDVISSLVVDPRWVISRQLELGESDVVYGNAGEDVLIGGAGTSGFPGVGGYDDYLDGDAGDDLIFGDAVELFRRDVVIGSSAVGSITDPRFQALVEGRIYTRTDLDSGNPDVHGDNSGEALVQGVPRDYRDTGGVPDWAEYAIVDLFHSAAIEASATNSFGDDYIAGGPNDDVIFGQLGDDVIQGDGGIEGAVNDGLPVGAYRVAAPDLALTPTLTVESIGTLWIRASYEAVTDGDDYIEAGGGDVVFGGLGQDDIIGGSSGLYTLDDGSLRPDGADLLFGGAGTQIDRNHDAAGGAFGADAHSRDADTILGDNGNIYRIVGINGTDAGALANTKFNYDNYGGRPIVVRATTLLDYTQGGPSFDAAAANDIGGADEIHGESGDDTIYGQRDGDVIFGDGEDDDLIGGWGHDWISGGTGVDGVLGDDGRIFTSRNGLTEPLNGVTTPNAQATIDTPGDIQIALIFPSGQLNKVVDLTPFNLTPKTDMDDPLHDSTLADDSIYGGLGNDFLHGGAGDDAISGGEALPLYFAQPTNPGNILRFGELRAGEHYDYDETDPRTKLDPYFLNWSTSEGTVVASAQWGDKHSDGDDVVFGDLGNDWLVGGTGKDTLWGGWGNDILNADDDLDTNGGANDEPETHPSYEDRAFGGAGLDVLYGNTGGDRLIDWVGEFNSYIVPFAPFGMFTVSRQVPPGLYQFLYDLSKAQGADPTRASDTGNSAARNGEPDGEIGLITQQDPYWGDQTGAPTDPQPGNIPGGRRDVLRGADFNNGQMQGFAVDSGTWTVSGGKLEVSASSLHGDAVAVYHVDEHLPIYFELALNLSMIKPTAGWNANAYVIFDYWSPTDFKFAGLNQSTNKIEMGRRTTEGWIVDVQKPLKLWADQQYQMLVAVNGTVVTVLVNGSTAFTYAYTPRVVDGVTFNINAGWVGIGSNNARGSFDNVAVQVLPPQITLDRTEEFNSSPGVLTGPSSGTWQVQGGRYVGTISAGAPHAISLADIGASLHFSSYLELRALVRTSSLGGFVFDAYDLDEYKFVALDVAAQRIVVGQRKGGSIKIQASFSWALQAGVDYDVRIILKGTGVSITINGVAVGGYVFFAALVDGAFGLLAGGSGTSFDRFRVVTDDRAFSSSPTKGKG